MTKQEPRSKTGMIVVVSLIVVAIGAITTFGLWGGGEKESTVPAATPVATPAPTAPATTTPPAAAGTPKPYEYDAANNRHWDPNHGHWHPGLPPNTTNAFGSDASLIQTPSAVNPNAPKPWEYDEVNNRHFDPNHGHWHDGPPPTPPGGGTP